MSHRQDWVSGANKNDAFIFIGIFWGYSKENFYFQFQYQFNWNVRDAEAETNGLFFEQTEGKNEETPDRTEGEYKVDKFTLWKLVLFSK